MKIKKIKIGEIETLFISIPYIYKNFKIVEYPKAGTYIMETDSKDLNHWKIKIPNGDYEIVGRSNELWRELVLEKLNIEFDEYINILYEHDITVCYSDHSNFWLVVVQLN